MAKEPVRNAALAAGGGFVGLAAFKAALALGAPLGGASWGGVHEGKLPWGLRIVSGVAVGFHVLAALIVLGRGGYRVVPLPGGVLRWGHGRSSACCWWGRSRTSPRRASGSASGGDP
jgi:hypothetical protein